MNPMVLDCNDCHRGAKKQDGRRVFATGREIRIRSRWRGKAIIGLKSNLPDTAVAWLNWECIVTPYCFADSFGPAATAFAPPG
jgi:hypothetical protein